MKLNRTSAIAIALSLAAVANSASAATVASGYTRPNHAGGIVAKEMVGSSRNASGAYNDFSAARADLDSITESYWVWAAADAAQIQTNNRAVYEFKFNSTGYDLSTMAIEGYWGVDNYGSISLNGVALTDADAGVSGTVLEKSGGVSNFQSANYFSIAGAEYFLFEAVNTLTFTLFDEDFDTFGDIGGSSFGAFQAITEVTAAAVPLPAGSVLGLSGLAVLAGFSRRRKT